MTGRGRRGSSLAEVAVMSAVALLLLFAILGMFRFSRIYSELTEVRLDGVSGALVILDRLRSDVAQVAASGSGDALTAAAGELDLRTGEGDRRVRWRYEAGASVLRRDGRQTAAAPVRRFEASCRSPAGDGGWLLNVSLHVGGAQGTGRGSRPTAVEAGILAPAVLHRSRFPEWVAPR